MSYHEHLKTEYWREVARRVKSAAGFKCQVCNSPHDLVAHHRTYAHIGDELNFLGDLICLCAPCHERFHKIEEVDGRRRATVMPDVVRVQAPSQKPQTQPQTSKRERNRHLRALKVEMRYLHRKAQMEREIELRKAQALKPKVPTPSLRKIQKEENRVKWEERNKKAKELIASLYDHEADMPKVFPFVVDEAFLKCIRTKVGGHTSKTLTALGVELPPRSGWGDRLLGKALTREQCWDALSGRECRSTLKIMRRIGIA